MKNFSGRSSLKMMSQGMFDACGWWRIFVGELARANARFSSEDIQAFLLSKEFVLGAVAYAGYVGATVLAAFVLSRKPISRNGAILTEVMAWLMVFLALLAPSGPMQFLYGVVFFSTGMAVHARIFTRLHDQQSSTTSFHTEWLNILYLNLVDRTRKLGQVRLPKISKLGYTFGTFLLADACTYLIREWIPDERNVSLEKQPPLQALAGAMWVLFVVDLFYLVGTTQLDLLGAPLPLELWHVHPLLAETFTEFWGVRWNPIIGKLLQDSFYKPLRRVGASRAACVVACFTGSAVLHTLPAFIATRSPLDTAMIFAFFILHGLAILLELTVKRLYNKVFGSGSSGAGGRTRAATQYMELDMVQPSTADPARELERFKHEERHARAVAQALACKAAPYQLPAELLLIAFLLSGSYTVLEFGRGVPPQHTVADRDAWMGVSAALGAGTLSMCYVVWSHVHRARSTASTPQGGGARQKHQALPAREFAWSLGSWLWGVAVMMLLLPLYSVPVLHCVENLYSQSFVVGPLIRTAQRVLQQRV